MKEILKNLVETTTLPEDSYLDQDAEILEIFVEEIEEIFVELQALFKVWFENSQDQETLLNIRRHFHTLKGSGRMVGAKSAAELAWTVEDLLNRSIAKTIFLDLKVQQFVQTVFNIYQYHLYPSFKNSKIIEIDLRPLVLLGQKIQQKQNLEPVLAELLTLSHRLTTENMLTGLERSEDPSRLIEIAEDIQETVTIFIEEAEEHLSTIEQFLQNEQEQNQDYNALIRALHTLRGSSSMAKIEHIFDISSKVENLFKTLLHDDMTSTSQHMAILVQYIEFIGDSLHSLKQNQTQNLDTISDTFNQVWDNYGFVSTAPDHELSTQGLVSKLIALNIDSLLNTELEFEQRAKTEFPIYLQNLSDQTQLLIEHTHNCAAIGIFEFCCELKSAYDAVLVNPALLNLDYSYELFAQVHQELIQLFDILAAGQRVALTPSLHKILNDLSAFVQQDFIQFEQNAITDLSPTVQAVGSNTEFTQIVQKIRSDRTKMQAEDANRDFDLDLLDIFLEEAEELLVTMDHDLNTWSENNENIHALNNLMRYLHTLKGGANMILASHIGLISHELESVYERIIRQQIKVTPHLVSIIRLIQDDIADRIQIIRENKIDYSGSASVEILRNIQNIELLKIETYDNQSEFDPIQQSTETAVTPNQEKTIIDESVSFNETPVQEAEKSIRTIAEQTFLEEAEEILDTAAHLFKQWTEFRSDRSLLLQLQRAAHSIKGGARMVENEPVDTICYQLETLFEQFGVHHVNSGVYDSLITSTFDWLRHAIFERNYHNFETLKQNLEAVEFVNVTAQIPHRIAHSDTLLNVKAAEIMQGDGTEPPAMLGEWDQSIQQDSNNEMIRISADLVEKMIDLSGENAINRSRIEMDLGQLGNTLHEMELAMKRLADQLRRMEGELESQIIAKHGSENSRYTDFDPLEMDQYSSLNQLSKSLAESASDLVDFKTTLAEKIRDTEGLLLQQSRIQAEIQESLMRTRLVPFSRLLPRLQRLVRQTSSTLNRPTELIVQNTEGELDRTILERMVTPFEHMLRNAIDHGIEDIEQRVQAQKSEVGRIELNISRHGTDVLISFSDDGRGIDENIVKQKALSLGLIKSGQLVDKQEILQFIFHPGFSTAKELTQISGRGVGLDIVQSEIKALGGHVTVDSDFGKGTTFTIRVPTTVAVSDALMVKVGDQQFAISLAQIDRIVRIAPSTLEEYFNSQEDFFKIDNVGYKLRYLSEFVANQPLPRLAHVAHSLPVLLIKGSSGQTIALLVDQLIGSRAQIVVKPIGQQFSNVGVVTGATILGDGQVCLILDGQNIARQIQTSQRLKHVAAQRENLRHSSSRRLIMIVDDSVTVRKVTSRLFERQGYDVVTAKDGLDAVEQLENVRPDLMLLDIEMPRMDGFEVTNLVRHHEIHQDLPIIMITSRTGEKHRERAFSLGVSQYMGKPFQETELLNNVEHLLAMSKG